jgi:oxygen-independent coproporphyrinogen III oxidase
MTPRSLYVHVPFCSRRCGYCDFAVEAVREPPVDAWLRAVIQELALTAEAEGWVDPLDLDTLYVGGGTPSLLGAGAMDRLRDGIAPFARLAPGAEWTCEANPESFDPALARDWKGAGVNRISLGAQSFDPAVLQWMGRLHGPDGPLRALEAAREAGFDDVSIDLIFGLPDRLERDWGGDLRRVLEMAPEHVSLYGLTAEPGAPLGRWVAAGRERLADEDRYAEEYLLAHRVLTDAGFEHYEVSNFGRPGRASRHNFVYWSGAPYAALGPGAHSFLPPFRRWNHRSWSRYLGEVESGALPLEGEERVDEEMAGVERVWLGLRTRIGLALEAVTPGQDRILDRWVSGGLASVDSGVIRLTPEGWLLLDGLAVELVTAGEVPHPMKERAIDARRDLVQIAANSNPSSA